MHLIAEKSPNCKKAKSRYLTLAGTREGEGVMEPLRFFENSAKTRWPRLEKGNYAYHWNRQGLISLKMAKEVYPFKF